jgi:phage/plasmid primase-like uncharacterized protein
MKRQTDRAPCSRNRASYDCIRNVREAARGNWIDIAEQCGVPLPHAPAQAGPCPKCEAAQPFRLVDRHGPETFFCSRAGALKYEGDGFDLLEHVLGWKFGHALRVVASMLVFGEARRERTSHRPLGACQPQPVVRADIAQSPEPSQQDAERDDARPAD